MKYKELANTKPNIKFDIERSFHNCKATLSFVFTKNKEETIGIQIEDNQFRLFKGNGNMTPNQIFQEYSNKGWFDPSYDIHTNKRVKDIPTKMRMNSKYCKYGQSLAYQYFDIWMEDRETNYQEYTVLANLLDKYLEQAFELLD